MIVTVIVIVMVFAAASGWLSDCNSKFDRRRRGKGRGMNSVKDELKVRNGAFSLESFKGR